MRRGKVTTHPLSTYSDDIVMDNGPGAGPWHRGRGKDDMALMLTEFAGFFGNTFHQDGRCVYADDRMAICLFHETGTGPGGQPFDDVAVSPSVFVRTGKRTGSGPLTSTPSTVKASGRKTQANPRKTFPLGRA